MPVGETKLRPPSLRGRNVPRAKLIARLERARTTPIVVVTAGPGWGKTTLLAQWGSRSERPFAWVTLDARDNDPVVLLSHVAVALDRVTPLDPGVFEALASPSASVEGTILPRLSAALTRVECEAVLVLDDLQLIDDAHCADVIGALATHLPRGLQLAVATRDASVLPMEVARAQGLTLAIGPDELRMDLSEARRLLRAAGVRSTAGRIAELLERTEGWPAGLQLAAQALSARQGPIDGPLAISGADGPVADYLRTAVLAHLSAQQLDLLTSTSVLHRLSGPLCDAVLEERGSASALEALARSNLFVVALDDRREWYRHQRLVGDFLRGELRRSAPEREVGLRARAIDWCEAHEEADDAIAYAQEAGEVERVARLVDRFSLPTYYGGRVATVEGWLAWLDARGALAHHATLAVLGGLLATARGRSTTSDRLVELAAGAPSDDRELPDGSPSIDSWRRLLDAKRCSDGLPAMRSDAEFAVRTLARTSPHRPNAVLLLGIATLLAGEADEADDLLADVVEEGVDLHVTDTAAIALAERAWIAIGRDDCAGAEALVDRSMAIVDTLHEDPHPSSAFVCAVAARIAQHRGDAERVDELLARARLLAEGLTGVLPYLAVQTRLELARVDLARAETARAETRSREIDNLLREQPDLGILTRRADDLRATLEAIRVEAPATSTLTAAELRVLPHLDSHLSFREIGERLYVSPHTVKSHAMAIYRKLGVTCRADAVERTREVGLR